MGGSFIFLTFIYNYIIIIAKYPPKNVGGVMGPLPSV